MKLLQSFPDVPLLYNIAHNPRREHDAVMRVARVRVDDLESCSKRETFQTSQPTIRSE